MRNINETQIVYNGIDGIWNLRGCLPNPKESISISVEQSQYYNSRDTSTSGSLLDLLGFGKEEKDIGVIVPKVISELIVLLPMTNVIPKSSTEPLPANEDLTNVVPARQDCEPCLDSNTTDQVNPTSDKFYHSGGEGAYLFKIDEQVINDLLGIQNYKTVNIYELRNIIMSKSDQERQNSIMRLMTYMVNYNFPPHLNWLLDTNLPPICMYGLEFSTQLSVDDLSNIWQNNMPKKAKVPEEEEAWLEHELNSNEIFGGYDLISEDFDIKMKVFKVKKRANNNYRRDLIGDPHDITNETQQKWYNYNWPYDYFSLVELVSIEAGEVYGDTDKPYSNIVFSSYQPRFIFPTIESNPVYGEPGTIRYENSSGPFAPGFASGVASTSAGFIRDY